MKNNTAKSVLTAENELLKNKNIALENEIKRLENIIKLQQEQARLGRHKLFGASSERYELPAEQALLDGFNLFNEIEKAHNSLLPEPEIEEIKYKRRKQKGKRELDFAGLPTEQIVCELPENERICPECNTVLEPIGQIVYRRELTVIPAQYKVTEYVQITYGCKNCEQNNTETPIAKADVPAPLIPNSGVASPSLAASIAHNKFALSLPLYRQEKELKNSGVNLSRQTMANWLIYIYQHYLQTFIVLLTIKLLAHDVLHADETTVQVLHEEGKKGANKIVYVGNPNVRREQNSDSFVQIFAE